jgi:hypothetical protein
MIFHLAVILALFSTLALAELPNLRSAKLASTGSCSYSQYYTTTSYNPALNANVTNCDGLNGAVAFRAVALHCCMAVTDEPPYNSVMFETQESSGTPFFITNYYRSTDCEGSPIATINDVTSCNGVTDYKITSTITTPTSIASVSHFSASVTDSTNQCNSQSGPFLFYEAVVTNQCVSGTTPTRFGPVPYSKIYTCDSKLLSVD